MPALPAFFINFAFRYLYIPTLNCMKKGILLSLGAVVLLAVIVCAIWYINEEGEMRAGSKDSFIPYNSAVILNINACPELPAKVGRTFLPEWKKFSKRLLPRVADTLRQQGYVLAYPYVLAARVEGKSDVALLYVMDNKDVLSRGEMGRFLNQAFGEKEERVRKYDKHKIYTLRQGKEEVYFAICRGIILISDSDLYIEDGLKQFDQEEAGHKQEKSRYQQLDKYFSAEADVNIFLNTAAFTDLVPLYVQTRKWFPHLDVSRLFKWGALDGEIGKPGVVFNGFMQYEGAGDSYMTTFEKQHPRESHIGNVVPGCSHAVGLLNLSDLPAYFSALDAYRYATGRKENIFRRKQQLDRMFGKGTEEKMRDLLQGEFALVELAYNEANGEKDGLVIAGLKSGSLCQLLIEKMMKAYAWFDKQGGNDYEKTYRIDSEKSFTYYRFPAEDWAEVYWGGIFEGIKNRYVLVEDNYLVLASSEKALKSFLQDYVHGRFVRDAAWYRDLKTQLSGKYNLAYLARTAEVLPAYRRLLTARGGKECPEQGGKLSVFPAFALQWSNEEGMFYTSLFLSTSEIRDEVRPHVLWQTKLDARVSMKPVPVINHVTREKELFVQDDAHTVYLINDVGRILWKLPVDGRINSEVYQVDLFKNGKLQYLFSTDRKMYLIDRNGNAAGRFPVSFKAACKQGISVYDYDDNRNYRIFVPAEDRKVYLYGLDGNIVQGWDTPKADKPIVSKVQHFRVGNKDYIVFADAFRLYILDRKGKERVRVSSVFDLKDHTDIYLTRKGGQPVLVFAGKTGNIHIVNFAGQTEKITTAGLSDNYRMNVADVNEDQTEECIFTDGGKLLVYRLNGGLLYEKTLEAKQLGYPYIYRFSEKDERIGLSDEVQRQLFLLLADGSLSPGFPIAGDSPFSIVFAGNDGFFLFAGADEGSVIKYKVQR